MALNIKDPATEKAVRELAAATGESITAAVRRSVEERQTRLRPFRGRPLHDEIMEIADHCAALPVLDPRTLEEIIGYDEHGLPT
ncbi:MAG TPA: type II toxin-antitoxin system VapB family antitoxin [Caulobacteraceae bacterium]|nr:type II toxin-antitoxin system VapB family antitoxin [Caulobacteraceae bacterium]